MPRTIAVIDGNSLMHRAYHAIQTPMTAPDGTPTNAAFGFMSMLLKFYETAHPDGIVCAFDQGKPKFRIEAMEQYKAQRPPMDEELHEQFPVVESLLAAMNIPIVKVPGWEGDDILGTVAARDEARGMRTILVSGDKDVNQLVTDLTHVMTTKKGITDVVIYDPAMVKERYGIEPAQFPDYLGFMGDTSDNIPGVPGIGPKTATKLLQAYGSMEGVYEHLDELKGKQRERISENREQAFLSRKIATIVRDLDFDLDVDAVKFPAFDVEAVEAAFGAIRFQAHLDRLLALTGQGTTVVAAEVDPGEVAAGDETVRLVDRALAAGERIGIAAVDEDAKQASLFSEPTAYAFATSEGTGALEGDEGAALLARVVREGKFAAHDAKALVHRVFPMDSAEPAAVSEAEVLDMDAFDCALAAYVLNSSAGKYPLEGLVEEYLAAKLPDTDDRAARAAAEACALLKLMETEQTQLDADGTAAVYADIDRPLIGVLAIMERNGAPLDTDRLEKLGAETQVKIDDLRARIYELAGEEFNVDSPQQLSHILFDVLGLKHGKKTRRGYSTDAKVLKRLAEDHELPRLVLDYREHAKIKSTYIDALPRLARDFGDGRVHGHFNETVTTTGRLSSSDPNLQNIPVRTEFGRSIRECFVPLNPGDRFLSADYSQIELRLLAHLSADEHLVAAFNSGADFHASTASRVFGVPIDEVTPAMRSRAKAVNFGIVYGQQAFGLSQSLGIPMAEAREMIDRYFEVYPGVRTYLDNVVDEARERGFATTMFGRKRHIPELASKNAVQRGFGERTAMNHPMQGTAADIIKLAMTKVQRRLTTEGFEARLLVQVHDELDFSAPEDEVERLGAMVKDTMEHVVDLSVPLIADVQCGDNWAQAH